MNSEQKKLGRNEKAYESLRESMKIGTEIGAPGPLNRAGKLPGRSR